MCESCKCPKDKEVVFCGCDCHKKDKELYYNEKECQGECPNCYSQNINWHESELQDNFMIYHADCQYCGQKFVEEYRLVYNITVMED